MKTTVTLLLAFVLAFKAQSQTIISQFTWDSDPVTKAEVGPNAISVSSAAKSSAGGSKGNGLNPGTPTMDINLTIKDSSIFNLPGIDLSIDFLRREGVAHFFTRGSSLVFGMDNGALFARFRTTAADGSFVSVAMNNIYAVPSDMAWHTYRFVYNNYSGLATVYVDGTAVASNQGTAGSSLYWTGAGNLVIGVLSDATGNNVPIYDNFLLRTFNNSGVLPLTLMNFAGKQVSNGVKLDWTTAQEINIDYMSVERSYDATNFISVGKVAGTNTMSKQNYTLTDATPVNGTVYYRLKIVDQDGRFTYSSVVSFRSNGTATNVNVYPNPATDYVYANLQQIKAGNYQIQFFSVDGRLLTQQTKSLTAGSSTIYLDLPKTSLKTVVLVITNEEAGFRTTTKLTTK